MLYLATPPTVSRLTDYVAHNIGVMDTPMMGTRIDRAAEWPYWAADNGCYSAGDRFSLDQFVSWLESRRPYSTRCLFAVAPDVMCDPRATWERSREVLPMIRNRGYRAALVAQNGIENAPIDWPAFDVLFIGGDTAWKDGPAADGLMREAKARGKWVHVGRVNSLRRLRLIQQSGGDSADGTYLAFGPDRNLPRLVAWLTAIRQSRPLLATRGAL